MTRRGFGEMALTGCTAGPIYECLIGFGLSTLLRILKNKEPIPLSVYLSDGSLNQTVCFPLCLIFC